MLEFLYGTRLLEEKLSKLRAMDEGTVGKEIACMLDRKGYRLIPKYENHDLKHIVLGYEMTMKDEIIMQAYLVGNGNLTGPCLIFLSLALFYPKTWTELPNAYRCGKKRKSIHLLTIDACRNRNLKELQEQYGAVYGSGVENYSLFSFDLINSG